MISLQPVGSVPQDRKTWRNDSPFSTCKAAIVLSLAVLGSVFSPALGDDPQTPLIVSPNQVQEPPAAISNHPSGGSIAAEQMQQIYDEVKTPFKYGIVIKPTEHEAVDCPNVFRYHGKWYMTYVAIKNKVGYETLLAESDDLLAWQPLGAILPLAPDDETQTSASQGEAVNANSTHTAAAVAWDRWQADGSIALVDPTWGGSGEIQAFAGKYWMSYFGNAKQGYEPDPLSIGIAWTSTPNQPKPWTRYPENPVLAPDQPTARSFERATLYKSHVLWDKSATLGSPFVMFYNAKQAGRAVERIGMAVSSDMLHWSRFGDEPVIDNGKGISGDPQIVKIGDLWVMFYFGAGWRPHAFDTFACSVDLVHWTKWTGPDLVAPSEPWDKTFAHKPWLIKHLGVVYHFYCAVGNQGRAIALATSKDLHTDQPPPTTTH